MTLAPSSISRDSYGGRIAAIGHDGWYDAHFELAATMMRTSEPSHISFNKLP